ncbi:hypothetical protein LOZ66_004263 [Ophidiomyces ophidiicola]|nr:hypothetical protein LOZ65_003142 [Ophidiomyces ophidiicola]KAI1936759.1 hypothetical protein LOZ66_004263 [Ophidiomyces ophidiicola]
MADTKRPSIPSWQLAAKTESSSEEGETTAPKPVSPPDEATLLDQASRFLQDESIRDAPTDKKIAFLESKGLKKEIIQKLLGESVPEVKQQEPIASVSRLEEVPLPEKPAPFPTVSQQASAPVRDVPPIITYPEFLAQAPKPPPLVNLRTVLYTLYGAATLASTMYGASEFLIKPMIASLTEARQELAETTKRNLSTLNDKLEKNVSTIPPSAITIRRTEPSEEDEETDSITSDPTELFHRDIATQTGPELEKLPTAQPSTSEPVDARSDAERALDNHVSRIKSLSSQLHDVLYSETQTDSAYTNTKDRLSDLQTYLDSLTYSSPAYLSSSLYGAYGDDSRDGKSGMSNGEADAISAFRAEVRSAKGVLLSARNFPAGSRGTVRALAKGSAAS